MSDLEQIWEDPVKLVMEYSSPESTLRVLVHQWDPRLQAGVILSFLYVFDAPFFTFLFSAGVLLVKLRLALELCGYLQPFNQSLLLELLKWII